MDNSFYSVQMYCDGFGHDTSTEICFRTKEECQKWIEQNQPIYSENLGYEVEFEIVLQEFGTPFEQIFG